MVFLVLMTGCARSLATGSPSDRPAAPLDAVIGLEAEAYHGSGNPPWIRVTEPIGHSGPAAVAVPDLSGVEGSELEEMTYEVDFDRAGTYYVWVRGFAPDPDANSVHVGLNGDWDRRVPVEFATNGLWSWTETTVHDARATIDVPEPGVHELALWARDERVIIDRLELAGDPLYVPSTDEGALLWSADHETGDLSQWNESPDWITCGEEVNNEGASAAITDDYARSGRFAVELRITDVEGDQGTRLFRGRCESMNVDALYYSAWLYFPGAYATVAGWWNVWQWKSQAPGAEDSEALWVLDVAGDGREMHFRMRDKIGSDSRWHDQDDPLPIPLGEWFHVEAFYLSDSGDGGRVVVWQDGVEIFRFHDVKTIHPGGDTRWSVNNYTSAIRPDPAVLFLDDAAISTQRIGPARSDAKVRDQ